MTLADLAMAVPPQMQVGKYKSTVDIIVLPTPDPDLVTVTLYTPLAKLQHSKGKARIPLATERLRANATVIDTWLSAVGSTVGIVLDRAEDRKLRKGGYK